MFVLFALSVGCQSDFDPREPFVDCRSETLDSDGTLRLVDYNDIGWPIREEVVREGEEPVVYDTEYNLVVGRVIESVTLEGPRAERRIYDGHEHLLSIETNLDGAEIVECTLTHQGDGQLLTSVCTDGIETTYDLCDNLITRTSPEGLSSYGYTYDECRILNRQILGSDEAGPFAANEQFFNARPVSFVREQDASLWSSITTWDCPTPL